MPNPQKDLQALLGGKGWLTPPDSDAWQRDWLQRYGQEPLGVARPKTTEEVAKVVSICRNANVAIVPQGGNTGLVGGSVLGESLGVILSTSRMDELGEPDIVSRTIEVESGVILAHLHEALQGTGLMFPMHLGSEGSAQVGGLVSTNAGGSHAFRYGMMRDLVIGLEVVLPDGSVWNGMRRVQKDNSGYQLRGLFCGAEGTLGVVTKAVLRLAPEPTQQVTALLALNDLNAASRFAAYCQQHAGEFLSAMEFFSDFGVEMALNHIPDLSFPLGERSPIYLLLEVGGGSARVSIEDILSELVEWGTQAGLLKDGVLASSLSQRTELWRLREEQPEGQRLSGPQLKHDISVPPGLVSEFVRRGGDSCEQLLPGVRINAFGHLCDGNIHYNLSPPPAERDFAGREDEFAFTLGDLAGSLGGSFAAEHGLGRAKNGLADRLRSPVERNLMKALKFSFDKDGIFNPGVLV